MNKTAKFGVAILTAAALASSAYAAKPGAYLGAGIGVSKLDTPNQNIFNTLPNGAKGSQSKKIGGVGGRLFGGYNFNKYVGIEAGVAHYAPSNYNSKFAGNNVNVDYKLNALDLVGKAYLPLGDSGFSPYVLGGAAYVRSSYDGVAKVGNQTVAKVSKTQSKVRPVYGVGVAYAVPNSAITTNLEFSRIQGQGNVKRDVSAIPTANMVSFNFAYNLD